MIAMLKMFSRELLALLFAIILGTFSSGAEPPALVLDLSHWKLTLPVSSVRAGRPDEIEPPQLELYQDTQSFFVADSGNSVVFRAHCGGVPTKGSKYPRCELRELRGDGKSADWQTDDGATHSLIGSFAITKTPRVKEHVVCAQIHDSEDDLLMIRLEGRRLLVEREGYRDVELIQDYSLGKAFDLKIEAASGHVQVWCDRILKLDWKVSRKGCYFKAGCYTQSNNASGDDPEAYGEVRISRLKVTHSDPR